MELRKANGLTVSTTCFFGKPQSSKTARIKSKRAPSVMARCSKIIACGQLHRARILPDREIVFFRWTPKNAVEPVVRHVIITLVTESGGYGSFRKSVLGQRAWEVLCGRPVHRL